MAPARSLEDNIDAEAIGCANVGFGPEITSGRVAVHLGDSGTVIESMPDRYFDWMYIDGDHSYEGVKRDLGAASKVEGRRPAGNE